jgi:hypothetical protein
MAFWANNEKDSAEIERLRKIRSVQKMCGHVTQLSDRID